MFHLAEEGAAFNLGVGCQHFKQE